MHAIHDDPADDLPRLAYADWLEEHGEAEHAEFIRVELRLAKLSRQDPDWRPLFLRELALIRAGKDRWFGRCRADWGHYEVRRGFIDQIMARTAGSVVPHADWLLACHALEDLSVRGDWAELRPLLPHPLTGVLARLVLLPAGAGWPYLNPVVLGLPLAERPLVMSLHGHQAGPELVDDLLASPHLGRLSRLDLSSNRIGPEGLCRLLDGLSRFPSLEDLILCGQAVGPTHGQHVPNIGREGIVLLAEHPATARLRRIDLAANHLDTEGAAALARSPFLDQAQELKVGVLPEQEASQRLQARFGARVVVAQVREARDFP
jgi:uncharacterized protein (TIGR02996 family)